MKGKQIGEGRGWDRQRPWGEIGEIEHGWVILTTADDINDGWARSIVVVSEGERDWEELVRGTETREREPMRKKRKEKVKREEKEKRIKNY